MGGILTHKSISLWYIENLKTCNKPVIYWPMSEANAFKNFFRSNLKYRKILPAYLLDSEKKDQQPVEKSKCKKGF